MRLGLRCAVGGLVALTIGPTIGVAYPASPQDGSGSGSATAQQSIRDQREAPVGVRARVEQVRLPGPELSVQPIERGAELVLRIVAVWKHGTDHRYDFEYYGLEPGSYDLAALLQREDGSRPESLPAVPVTISATLPPGQVEPSPLIAAEPPALGGYRLALWGLGGLWAVGLGIILFGFRRRRTVSTAPPVAPPRSLAERLRPMIEDAVQGRLGEERKAELERLLLAHWQRRLELGELPARDALLRLREHPESGPLLRQLEVWLHRPDGGATVDIEALLAPYRGVVDLATEEHRS